MSGPRLVGLASAVILSFCLALLAVEGIGEDGFRAVIRLTARTSLVLFLLAFSASAAFRARRGPATRWLLANRRYLGLSFACSQLIHLLAIGALAWGYPTSFWPGTAMSAVVVGGIGYLFIAAMAATSNDASVAWLGRQRWQLLHTVGGYWIWQVFLVTYALGIPRAPWKVVAVALLLASLTLRLATRQRRPVLAVT